MDDCRAWLESYKEIRSEVQRLDNKLHSLQEQATKITPTLSDMPKGGNSDKEKVLAALADTRGELTRRYMEFLERQQKIESFIDRVDGDLNRMILRLRYIELLKWPAVQEALMKAGVYYEERNLFVLHGKALNAARSLWRKERSWESG